MWIQGEGHPTPLLVQAYASVATMEIRVEIAQMKIDIPYDPAIPPPGTYPKEVKSAYESFLQLFIYGSTIHNGEDIEKPKMSIERIMDGKIILQLLYGPQLSL